MAKKRIFIAIQYLEIGGAERSLIGLLNAIDYTKYDVDLFVYSHTGEFMKLVPNQVRLLPEISKYACISKPMTEVLRKGYLDIILARLWAKHRNKQFKKERREKGKDSIAVFQYIATATTPFLPSLKKYGTYDLAISFLIPHNIVRDKVAAKKKWAWIHTDYSSVSMDVEEELPVWSSFDKIITISDSVSQGFLFRFPSLKDKLMLVENILSEKFVRDEAEKPLEHPLWDNEDGVIKLCSVGRFSYPKAFDRAAYICKNIVDKGLRIKWYIIGYGATENLIREAIAKTQMEDHFILLGKQSNPYPFIKACDFYIQPSRYEGKAVTVREAQILEKPVIITNFPTAPSQLQDGIDGIIVPDDIEGAAQGIISFIQDTNKQKEIKNYLHTHHYGNEEEAKKLDLAFSEE